jgi:hypothetical protein
MEKFDRITQDPAVMGGKACIRGMRVAVGMLVSQIGAGHTINEILATIRTSSARTFCKLFATPPGWPKTAKSQSQMHEVAGGDEPLATRIRMLPI